MFSLSNVITIFKRELKAYFDSAIAYIYIIVFILFLGSIFMTQFFIVGQAEMRYLFAILPAILCVFIPAITMRLWAEDKRENTFELLLTFPVRPYELVLGKFLSSFAFYVCALLATLPIAIMVSATGNPDAGPMIGGYIGALFLGAFFLAVGIFVSGLCRDQIVAFIGSMILCFAFFLIGTEFIAASIDGWIPGLGSFLGKFFGLLRHYSNFEKGVIDVRSLLYFLMGTAVFLVLNSFYVDARMRPRSGAAFSASTALCVLMMALFNWFFADMPIGRFDLTDAKIYTTSPVTRELLKGLKVPVTVKLYVSSQDKMPTGFKTIEQDVVDKLAELRDISGGNLSYKIFHMEAANVTAGAPEGEADKMEQQLMEKGIQPFQVQSIEADEVGVKMIYAAISIAYKEKPEETIPRVTPNTINELEYLVVSKIYRLTMDKKPSVALMAPFSETAIDPNTMNLLSQLGLNMPQTQRDDKYRLIPKLLEYEGYDTVRIGITEDDPIPEGTDTLVIIQPEGLNDRQRFEINKFLVQGGSLFIAVQNYNIDYTPSGRGGVELMPRKLDHGLSPLVKEWGVDLSENILMDSKCGVLNIQSGMFGPFSMSTPIKAPVHIEVDEEGMNSELSITSSLSPILYIWGSALKVDDAKLSSQGLEKKAVLSSSKGSWEIPFSGRSLGGLSMNPPSGAAAAAEPLALLLRGQFADAYAGKAVPEWPKKEPQSEAETTAAEPAADTKAEEAILNKKPGELLITGCSAFLTEDFFNIESHRTFLMNAVDVITLGEDLVKVRSKRITDRYIAKIPTGRKVMWRFFASFLVPILMAVTGGTHLIMRRQAKKRTLISI